MDWKPDICIYHDPCDDGFAAAWCVWKKWGDAIDFRPTNYGLPVPDEDIDGKRILIVDFSFKPDVMQRLAERAGQIVMLDHHKTAKEDCDVLPHHIVGAECGNVDRIFARMSGGWQARVLVEFDMHRSGAVMAWRFCFSNAECPEPIRHIQDRDLWRFKLNGTRAFTLYLRSFERSFDTWGKVFADQLANPDRVRHEAMAIERFYDQKIAAIVPTATFRKIADFDEIPVASAPYDFVSDVGHALLKAHPDAPFAAVTVDAYGSRTYSLRSEDGREDVSAVARKFGGGGHRNAAGFRVPA